uniref:Reverse transcriptase domain-containing protein n=1 Tax=Fagus sylvatica TaxID=28930 RepID=A0A2N9HPK1_FAGSY
MEKLGFNGKWVALIRECISSPYFSILINGSPHGFFSSSRGLRQGDPLSPFLFIIGAEILSRILLKAESEGQFKGFQLARSCPKVSHLLFADDLIIFSRALREDATAIQGCIDKYQLWSGQKVNVKKSVAMFSKKVPQRYQRRLCRLLGLKNSPFHSKYLGLPLSIDKSRSNTLEYVVERVQNKVQGWKRQILSQASRTCLIRSVAAATPIYPMSSLIFPKSTCAKIDVILRDFWWGKKEDKVVLYLKAWDSICTPKSVGGLGIRRSIDMNKALLAKMGWSVAIREDKMWVKFVIAKYLKGKSFWIAKKSNVSSWAWQSILSSRNTLSKGICWRVSKGIGLDAWNAPWIPSMPDFKPRQRIEGVYPVNWVSELIHEGSRSWDRNKLVECFDDETVNQVMLIPLDQFPQDDKLIWFPSRSGTFSTKIAFWIDQQPRFDNTGPLSKAEWKSLWKLKIHDRLKLLLWKLAWNSLPTRDNLGVRFHLDSLLCPLCDSGIETLKHLFIECPISRIAWSLSPWSIRFDSSLFHSFVDWIKLILKPSGLGIQKSEESLFSLYAAISCDVIWRRRNEVLQNPESLDPKQIANNIRQIYYSHCQAWEYQVFDRGKSLSWRPPNPPSIKINFDAAMGVERVGLAAVCRDHKAKVLFIWSAVHDLIDPLLAEAKAALLAVNKAFEAGFQSIVLEGDSLLVIQAIQNLPSTQIWTIDSVIFDIQSLLAKFSFWNASHAYRELNIVAHSIARWALSYNCSGTFPISAIPSTVLEEWVEGIGSPASGG